MTPASAELYHNGKNWVLNILIMNTTRYIEINVTDAQADEYKEAGVPVYKG